MNAIDQERRFSELMTMDFEEVTSSDSIVLAAQEIDPSDAVAGDICSHEALVFIAPDNTVQQALELMRTKAVRRLPVVDRGRSIGIITLGDRALEHDTSAALADISAMAPNH
jgi:predicted transcriptional regulator